MAGNKKTMKGKETTMQKTQNNAPEKRKQCKGEDNKFQRKRKNNATEMRKQ